MPQPGHHAVVQRRIDFDAFLGLNRSVRRLKCQLDKTFLPHCAIGLALLWQAPRTAPVDAPTASTWSLPWASPAFRRLLLVYLVIRGAGAISLDYLLGGKRTTPAYAY